MAAALDPGCPNCRGGNSFFVLDGKNACPICKGKLARPNAIDNSELIECKLQSIRDLLRLYRLQTQLCDPLRFTQLQRIRQLTKDIEELEALECQKKE